VITGFRVFADQDKQVFEGHVRLLKQGAEWVLTADIHQP
jgi:hypothetical protein